LQCLILSSFECNFAEPGEKKELDDALAAQREESKKELAAAIDSAAARERGYADQLAALAQAMGGKCSFFAFDMTNEAIECHEMTCAMF
jgi:hypothetical protein